jgi:hypothetical protein
VDTSLKFFLEVFIASPLKVSSLRLSLTCLAFASQGNAQFQANGQTGRQAQLKGLAEIMV